MRFSLLFPEKVHVILFFMIYQMNLISTFPNQVKMAKVNILLLCQVGGNLDAGGD
jgi:hypothetical protein